MDHRPSHTLLLKAARALELLIAAVILVVIVCAAGLLLWDTARTLVLRHAAAGDGHRVREDAGSPHR